MKKGIKIKMKNMIWIGMIFVVFSFAYADFGQSAGMIDFENITIGNNKTLSYYLFNTGEIPINFEIEHTGDIIVNPKSGTINPNEQVDINVTVFADQIGKFNGKITAIAEANEKGTVVLQVGLEKNFKYVIVNDKIKERDQNEALMIFSITILAILLIFFSLHIYNLKGGKKKWNFGK